MTFPSSPSMAGTVTHGVLLGFAGFAAYAMSDASVKLIDGGLPPYESAFIGAVIGLLGLPFLKARQERLSDLFRTVNRPLWLLRFFSYPLGVIGSVTAFTTLSMSEAFVLMFLLPAYVTLLSLFWLKEPVDRHRWAALAIGFVGVLIVLRPGFRELTIGHVGAIIGGLSGAISVVTARALGTRETRCSLLGSGFLGGAVICGAFALPDFTLPDLRQSVLLLGYGGLAVVGALLVMQASFHAPGAFVGPTQYSQMLWAVLFDVAIFHNRIDLPMVAGIVLIVGSGLLTVRRSRPGTAGH